MALRVAFAGLKHYHVHTVLKAALEDPSVDVVALAESDDAFRQGVERTFGVEVRYANHIQLLDSVSFDVLVVCEEFSRRGAVVIEALRESRHVFCDKPLCTSEEELWRIASLAGEKNLEVGLDLSLRHCWARTGPPLQQGEIGQIVSVAMFGPHFLDYRNRPRWYYEPGKHGGILNDLLGHGVDYVHWITRQRTTHVLSAWRARVGVPQEPGFETLGEAYLQLEGGATVFGHVDYLVPAGHASPWRFFVFGTEGDGTVDERGLCLRRHGEEERRIDAGALDSGPAHPFADFAHFLLEGKPPLRTTDEALGCSLVILLAQRAAETGETKITIPEISVHGDTRE